MVVGEIMSAEPFAIESQEPIGRAMSMLADAGVRHLPVIQDGALVGIISDRDLRAFAPPALLELPHPREIGRLLSQPVAKIMSSDVVSVDPETDVAEVVDLMLDNKIGAVPVVEAGSTKLIGIVSYMDVLRAVRDEL
jgi:acetoin utilization protein AcuB